MTRENAASVIRSAINPDCPPSRISMHKLGLRSVGVGVFGGKRTYLYASPDVRRVADRFAMSREEASLSF